MSKLRYVTHRQPARAAADGACSPGGLHYYDLAGHSNSERAAETRKLNQNDPISLTEVADWPLP